MIDAPAKVETPLPARYGAEAFGAHSVGGGRYRQPMQRPPSVSKEPQYRPLRDFIALTPPVAGEPTPALPREADPPAELPTIPQYCGLYPVRRSPPPSCPPPRLDPKCRLQQPPAISGGSGAPVLGSSVVYQGFHALPPVVRESHAKSYQPLAPPPRSQQMPRPPPSTRGVLNAPLPQTPGVQPLDPPVGAVNTTPQKMTGRRRTLAPSEGSELSAVKHSAEGQMTAQRPPPQDVPHLELPPSFFDELSKRYVKSYLPAAGSTKESTETSTGPSNQHQPLPGHSVLSVASPLESNATSPSDAPLPPFSSSQQNAESVHRSPIPRPSQGLQPLLPPPPTLRPMQTQPQSLQSRQPPSPALQPRQPPSANIQPLQSPPPTVQPIQPSLPTLQPIQPSLPTLQPIQSPLPTLQPIQSPPPGVSSGTARFNLINRLHSLLAGSCFTKDLIARILAESMIIDAFAMDRILNDTRTYEIAETLFSMVIADTIDSLRDNSRSASTGRQFPPDVTTTKEFVPLPPPPSTTRAPEGNQSEGGKLDGGWRLSDPTRSVTSAKAERTDGEHPAAIPPLSEAKSAATEAEASKQSAQEDNEAISRCLGQFCTGIRLVLERDPVKSTPGQCPPSEKVRCAEEALVDGLISAYGYDNALKRKLASYFSTNRTSTVAAEKAAGGRNSSGDGEDSRDWDDGEDGSATSTISETDDAEMWRPGRPRTSRRGRRYGGKRGGRRRYGGRHSGGEDGLEDSQSELNMDRNAQRGNDHAIVPPARVQDRPVSGICWNAAMGRWIVRWIQDGRERRRHFRVETMGYNEAYTCAVRLRREMEQKYPNENNSGRRGKRRCFGQ